MIEKLEPLYADGTVAPPDVWEMMDKINELVNEVNTLTLNMHRVLQELKKDDESTEETRRMEQD